ncbi:MAG: DMT family transporter [Bacteroidales bacterium]|jgi:drug/metabolite transporter (DMT)-like permease|nr:DMT family transporter [Bacteroidales bacterium]
MGTGNNKGAVYAAAMIAVIVWGFSYIGENFLITRDIPIFTFIFERMVIAAIMMFAFAKLTKKFQKIEKGDFKWFLLLAFSEPFIYFIGENFGIKYTGSPVVPPVVISTIPVFCIIVETAFMGVPFSVFKVVGTILSIGGIFMVVLKPGGLSVQNSYGILLLFMSVVGSVCYSFFVSKMAVKYNAITITTWQFIIGAVLFLPTFLLFGLKGLTPDYFSWPVQGTLVALAAFCSCICFALWVFIISRIGITRANIFAALIPAVAAIAAHLIGQEEFTIMKVIGILLAIVGVIIAQRQSNVDVVRK